MNTGELECILERALSGTGVRFLGVFAADRIPRRITTFPSCFVANTDPASKAGTHWVACFCATANRVEFFDSYGLPPSAYGSLRLPLRPTHTNSVSFQSLRSSACGHYCIYYLCMRARGRSASVITRCLRTIASRRGGNADYLARDFAARLVRRLRVVRRCFRDCQGMQCCKLRGAQ